MIDAVTALRALAAWDGLIDFDATIGPGYIDCIDAHRALGAAIAVLNEQANPTGALYADAKRCQVCGAVEGTPCVERMHSADVMFATFLPASARPGLR